MSAIFLVLLSTILHAGWNLVARALRANGTFLRVTVLIVLVGLPLALVDGQWRSLFGHGVWPLLAVAGCCQAVYFLGLTKGYESGDFTVVYPLARSLPILALALVDLARGRPPAPLAWGGMALVSLGCLLIPLGSPGPATMRRYLNRTTAWILLTALGTFGYSTVDKMAAELIAPGPWNAARYQVFEYTASLAPLALLLWWAGRTRARSGGALDGIAAEGRDGSRGRDGTVGTTDGQNSRPRWTRSSRRLLWRSHAGSGTRQHQGRSHGALAAWSWAALAAAATFAAYWLILWAYQLSPYASYVLAMRQLSIVIGVMAGAMLFREPAAGLRIGAALGIVAGVALIALAGT